ncbi:MAG: hypothetical protein WCH99_08485 [Verrucomicrobiota bacterium]
MNTNQYRVSAKFASGTRFALRPEADMPFRADLENEFERLKTRLLARHLETVEQPELNASLRRAANEAAALSWITFYPLLVFPALFEEKVGTALAQARRQSRVYANSRELLVA